MLSNAFSVPDTKLTPRDVETKPRILAFKLLLDQTVCSDMRYSVTAGKMVRDLWTRDA